MKKRIVSFNEGELARLFGHEAAEDESPERLREYYFKNTTYQQVVNDLPLRVLVGHKGIGKSALFQVAIQEEQESGKLSILIKPDDIASLGNSQGDFLQEIRDWKEGLNHYALKCIGCSWTESPGSSEDQVSCISARKRTRMFQRFLNPAIYLISCCSGTRSDRSNVFSPGSFFSVGNSL